MTRSWSKQSPEGGVYPSWHIRRDNASAFCGLPLPLGNDHDSFEPPNEMRTCESCFKREKEQRPPKQESDDGPGNP